MKSKTTNNMAKQPSAFILLMITISMLLIVAGTVLPLFNTGGILFKYIYATGALLLLIGRLLTPYKGDDLRVKRLYRIETWSAIFFCVAVFFMFYEGAGRTDWLAFTLAGGIIQIYTSIMIPRAIAKAAQKQKGENELNKR
jgi:Ni,Fe-hydrogenase I cytochrome b subunit